MHVYSSKTSIIFLKEKFMKRNIIALSLLVTCLSTSSRLHAMDFLVQEEVKKHQTLVEIFVQYQAIAKELQHAEKYLRVMKVLSVLDYALKNSNIELDGETKNMLIKEIKKQVSKNVE